MDLATTLALIILVGAIGLAVVTVLAFVIYKNCVQQNAQATPPPALAPHAPALDVPPPTVPSTPPPADGAPATLNAEPPRVQPEKSPKAKNAPQANPHFLEYDGATFIPVTPPSWEPNGNGSAFAETSANGFAWR